MSVSKSAKLYLDQTVSKTTKYVSLYFKLEISMQLYRMFQAEGGGLGGIRVAWAVTPLESKALNL